MRKGSPDTFATLVHQLELQDIHAAHRRQQQAISIGCSEQRHALWLGVRTVDGFITCTVLPSIAPVATNPLRDFLRSNLSPQRAAIQSATRKPVLCLVESNLAPTAPGTSRSVHPAAGAPGMCRLLTVAEAKYDQLIAPWLGL